MTRSPLAKWRRVAVRAGPLAASGLVHVLLVVTVLAVGVGSAPRWRGAVEAELIVLARDVVPSETAPAPRVAPPPPPVTRPPAVVQRPPAPRVSLPAPAPRPVEAPPVREEIAPKVEPPPPPPPPAREDVKVIAPPPRPDPPTAPAPRVDEAKSLAAAEPARGGGQEGRGATPDARAAGGSPFGAPAPSGTERPGSGRGGSGLSGQGGPGVPSGSGGTGVASLPGNAGGSGITRSAIPRGGYQVHPVYPVSARQQGIQGTSLLRVHVAADGRVTEIVVARSAGHVDMDEAAMAAVRQWRFEPGRRGQEAVSMWVVLPVEFRIK